MQQKPAADDELRSVCRRSRKDEEGRDFKCGCGKKYLSYPALYTHIKTKHQGKQPEGTQKTGTSNNCKRAKSKFQAEAWKDITSYLEREDLRVLNELHSGFQGYVPLNNRLRKDNIPKELYNCYTQLMKQSNVKISRNSPLDLVLVIYLLNVGEYVCQKLFDYFIIFARILRSCYLDHGEEVYQACFSNKEASLDYLSSFNVQQCKYVPIISDFMVRLYIPNISNEFKDVNSSLIELMLFDFCLWMKKRCLTCIEVNLKKPYHLEQTLNIAPSTKKIQQNHKQEPIYKCRAQNMEHSISSQKRPQDEEEIEHSQPQSDDKTSSNKQHQQPQLNIVLMQQQEQQEPI